MKRKSLMLGIIVAVAVLTACVEKAPQDAQGKEPARKAPAAAAAQKEATPVAPPQEGTTPQAGQQEAPATETASAQAEPTSSSGPGVDPKTGQKYLYKTDTYMVLSENPTVIQAIPKKPTAEELEAWKKERESVPLVTEVMTEEELRAYMKEKNIPLITKENFKPPELVWEEYFEDEIATMSSISDLAKNRHSIFVSGRYDSPYRRLYFLDDKGKILRTLALQTEFAAVKDMSFYNDFAFAAGGTGAAMAKIVIDSHPEFEDAQDISLSYFDNSGNLKWQRDNIALKRYRDLMISYNGETVALLEGNPHWSGGEWDVGVDLNCAKLMFFDSQSRLQLEFSGFKIMTMGEFSANGNYFAGIFWWQDSDFNAWGKFIYFDIYAGKIIWQIPFAGDAWKWEHRYSDYSYLQVSPEGSLVGLIDFEPMQNESGKKDAISLSQLEIIEAKGNVFSRSKAVYINSVTANGMVSATMVQDQKQQQALIDIINHKIALAKLCNYCSFNITDHLLLDEIGTNGSGRRFILTNYFGDVLWDVTSADLWAMRLALNGKSLKAFGGEKEGQKIKKGKITYWQFLRNE